MKEKIFKLIEEWLKEHDYPNGESVHQNDDCIIDSVSLVGDIADLFYDVRQLELMKVAYKYHEKGYNEEQLRDGDDLYNRSWLDKENCIEYFDEICEDGRTRFMKKINDLESLINKPST